MYRRFLLAPDKFKGTLRADEICDLLSAAIIRRMPDAEIRALPMADGGEGLTNAYLRILGGREERVMVTGPEGGFVEAMYGVMADGTGVAEFSSAAGLTLVKGAKDPLHATSRGVGELLIAMKRAGAKRILLGLGGSATNDCGIGMAYALGWRFYDKDGTELAPLAVNLEKIERIVSPDEPYGLPVTAACDVDNPLWGPEGATYTFGAQKGADKETLDRLEKGMRHFAMVLSRELGFTGSAGKGAGAAGGAGAAVLAFLKGSLRPGTEMLLDAARFDELLKNTDIVITGEGRIDAQSAHGKAPVGVAKRAKAAGVPCIALCGSIGPGAEALYDLGVTAMFSAVAGVRTAETLAATAEQDLIALADNVLRLIEL